jgi:hypothetical protein
MRARQMLLAGCAVIAGLAVPAGVRGAEGSEIALLAVRIYALVALPEPELAGARETAGGILGGAGIQVSWRDCRRAEDAPTPSACDGPLQPNEVILRIAAAAAAKAEPGTLGYSLIDTERRRGWLSTVFADRIGVLARQARTDRAGVLGRVMAHEIGHLLLGTTRHARSGLMRARWTPAEVSRRDSSWRFSLQEAADMRRDVMARAMDPPRELLLSAIISPVPAGHADAPSRSTIAR